MSDTLMVVIIALALVAAGYLAWALFLLVIVKGGPRVLPVLHENLREAERRRADLETRCNSSRRKLLTLKEKWRRKPFDRIASEADKALHRCEEALSRDSEVSSRFRGGESGHTPITFTSFLRLQHQTEALGYLHISETAGKRKLLLDEAENHLKQFTDCEGRALREHERTQAIIVSHEDAYTTLLGRLQEERQLTPLGLESLFSTLQPVQDFISSARALLKENDPRNYGAVSDAFDLCKGIEERIISVRSRLEDTASSRVRSKNILAQITKALYSLEEDLSLDAAQTEHVNVEDIKSQIGVWRTEVASLEQMPDSPQVYKLILGKSGLPQQISRAKEKFDARRRAFSEARTAIASVTASLADLESKLSRANGCEFDQTMAIIHEAQNELNRAKRLYSSL